jgi:hypothetical protein
MVPPSPVQGTVGGAALPLCRGPWAGQACTGESPPMGLHLYRLWIDV